MMDVNFNLLQWFVNFDKKSALLADKSASSRATKNIYLETHTEKYVSDIFIKYFNQTKIMSYWHPTNKNGLN